MCRNPQSMDSNTLRTNVGTSRDTSVACQTRPRPCITAWLPTPYLLQPAVQASLAGWLSHAGNTNFSAQCLRCLLFLSDLLLTCSIGNLDVHVDSVKRLTCAFRYSPTRNPLPCTKPNKRMQHLGRSETLHTCKISSLKDPWSEGLCTYAGDHTSRTNQHCSPDVILHFTTSKSYLRD